VEYRPGFTRCSDCSVGLGRLPFGQNLIIGPVEIQVNREDRENALELLKDLEPYRGRSAGGEGAGGDDN
jgi:hypothetical protein